MGGFDCFFPESWWRESPRTRSAMARKSSSATGSKPPQAEAQAQAQAPHPVIPAPQQNGRHQTKEASTTTASDMNGNVGARTWADIRHSSTKAPSKADVLRDRHWKRYCDAQKTCRCCIGTPKPWRPRPVNLRELDFEHLHEIDA